MKTYIKALAALVVGGAFASCAEQNVDEYIVEKPASLEPVELLRSYNDIKTYVDRSQNPNFKIGCALAAADYNARNIAFRVANRNFDEVTLDNGMTYGSVVAEDGTMDFSAMSEFLDNAEAAGVSAFGHMLASQSQQNVSYLNSLLADRTVDIGPDDLIQDYSIDYSDYTKFPNTLINDFEPVITDGVLVADIKNKKNQFYLFEDVETEIGATYEVQVFVKCNKEASIPIQFGSKENTAKMAVGTDWSTCKIKLNAVTDKSYVMVDPGNLKIVIEIATVVLGHYPPSSISLTPEEKVEVLKDEMARWTKGAMDASAGRVKAWDLISYAISDGGNVDGNYDLRHAPSSSEEFFWQDYFGSENYGPIVEAAARKAYAESFEGANANDLLLFVNDTDLESDLDNNKKLTSMIYWVNEWEKRGAKINGLGAELHLTYYEEPEIMESQAKALVNMLHIMANTGKLVRISGLDMKYVDQYDTQVTNLDMTKEMYQNMANYYRFVIQMYLKIVPKDQQYGICHWSLNDTASEMNDPVGLWDLNWERKLTYVAYVDAFTKALPSTEDYFQFLKAEGLTHHISD